MRQRASVQTAHIGLEAIEDDVMRISGGRYRAVLEVSSINFALQSEAEQEAIVAGFAAFLNGLSFPVQILVRAVPIDLEGYLRALERQALGLPEELADLARDHAAFVRGLARSRTLLERRFYLIVPAEEEGPAAGSPWSPWRRKQGTAGGSVLPRLAFRCDEVERELGRCGLTVRRLTSAELARLLHGCWCPELARSQRVRQGLSDLATLVVRAGRSTERRE